MTSPRSFKRELKRLVDGSGWIVRDDDPNHPSKYVLRHPEVVGSILVHPGTGTNGRTFLNLCARMRRALKDGRVTHGDTSR